MGAQGAGPASQPRHPVKASCHQHPTPQALAENLYAFTPLATNKMSDVPCFPPLPPDGAEVAGREGWESRERGGGGGDRRTLSEQTWRYSPV